MNQNAAISRRNFIKTATLSAIGMWFAPLNTELPWLPDGQPLPAQLGRVTRRSIPIYREPDFGSAKEGKLHRDEIINLLEKVESTQGSQTNLRWYRIEQGFIHSAFVQRVENNPSNPILDSVPAQGVLGEVTVPVIQSVMRNREGYWVKLYRLYFSSIHWITGIEYSPAGETLYQLTDEWLRVKYFVPAVQIKPLLSPDLTMVSSHIPDNEKLIEVSLKDQTLTAFEGKDIVRKCLVSSGVRYMETPTGSFLVKRKYPSKHMGYGGLTSDPNAYELIGIPWTTFFHDSGIAFHGTYWHDNFGTPMSHGCINLSNADALWVFRWTNPIYRFDLEDSPSYKVQSVSGSKVVIF